ncbi:hypothetical protein LTR62_008661 [Meristemomyces frigidus]|uniref:U3 small nucleolar RNA-associated protein 14 n=1 Tax=Meristemomyces frigidus TaxID=1508187 RepID=A0AAN7T9B6_9PEZI|nr:hypothetical protein LTR62_008661 [Meristemomyces frigidus]
MPARLARSSIAIAAPKNAKNKSKKRNLDAYSIASHAIKPTKIPRHRLGEDLDDTPRSKRRKTDEDGESGEDESEEDDGRRRKVTKRRGGAGEDDDIEAGSDSEGNNWVMGGLADDDDDSDLDSEEAFGESDEEKFEGFTFRGSSSANTGPKTRKVNVDKVLELNEEDDAVGDEEESDFGDNAVDLATMLDDDGDGVLGDDNDDGSTDEEDATSEGDSNDEDDSADDEERLARFRDRIEALDDTEQPDQPLLDPEDAGGLSLEDLLTDMDPAEKKQFNAAIKPKRKSKAPQKLTAPLPKRQQDRLDREVASQKAKEQLDRWRDTVIRNRRAEFLTFPLVDPTRSAPIGKDKFVTDGKPQGELEESIRKIMEESGMAAPQPGAEVSDGEGETMQAEELGTNHLPVEEVMRRRAELRRSRELMFREEIKARRIAKIKSKAYRRVHRRERDRVAGKERALLDPEGLGIEMAEDDKDKNDRKRAEERMSTKHRDSKFGKANRATNRTVWNEGAREGVMEQARRKEDLQKRMVGEDVGDEDLDSESDEDDGGSGDDEVMIRKLTGLEAEDKIKAKGVGGMKFMLIAEDRQRARNNADIERLRKEMAVADGDENCSGDEAEKEESLGRAIFGPKAKEGREAKRQEKRAEMEEGEASDEDARDEVEQQPTSNSEKVPLKSAMKKASGPLTARPLGHDRRDPDAPRPAHTTTDVAASGTVSTWLMADTGARKPADAVNAGKWLTAISGTGSKGDRRKQNTADEPAIDLALDTPAGDAAVEPARSKASANLEHQSGVSTTEAANTNGWQVVQMDTKAVPSDVDGDEEAQTDPILTAAEQRASYHRRAFAGDDVQAAFTAEKAADVADEDEKEISTHLPGWGSWTGSGLSKSIRRSNARAKHNPLHKFKLPGGVRPEERKDRKLDNVIVSEKQERKGKKYLAPILPREYETGAQYERSFRVPVGPEWSTKEVFQRGTRPRVLVKPGVVVGAMERPGV